jgi:hypothetical protein
MKRFLFSFVMLAAVVSVKAQTAEEVVTKYIDAIGGVDAWKKVNSMVMEGTMEVQGNTVNVTQTIVHGKGNRQDINVGGMVGYNIVNPTAGWGLAPWQGQMTPEPVTEEVVKKSQSQLDLHGILIDYAAKGHTIEYLGTDDVEGTACHKVKINVKDEDPQTWFFDAKSFLLIKASSKINMNGQEMESSTSFSNYEKTPEGVVIPKSTTLPFGELKINKVVINGNVDESIFTIK